MYKIKSVCDDLTLYDENEKNVVLEINDVELKYFSNDKIIIFTSNFKIVLYGYKKEVEEYKGEEFVEEYCESFSVFKDGKEVFKG